MSVDAIIAEIRQVRSTMDDSAHRMFELSEALHRHARKTLDQDASSYVAYANAYKRVSNMVGLGLRRTASTDRLVTRERDQRTRDLQEQKEREQKAQERRDRILAEQQQIDDPLMEVYGEVLNA